MTLKEFPDEERIKRRKAQKRKSRVKKALAAGKPTPGIRLHISNFTTPEAQKDHKKELKSALASRYYQKEEMKKKLCADPNFQAAIAAVDKTLINAFAEIDKLLAVADKIPNNTVATIVDSIMDGIDHTVGVIVGMLTTTMQPSEHFEEMVKKLMVLVDEAKHHYMESRNAHAGEGFRNDQTEYEMSADPNFQACLGAVDWSQKKAATVSTALITNLCSNSVSASKDGLQLTLGHIGTSNMQKLNEMSADQDPNVLALLGAIKNAQETASTVVTTAFSTACSANRDVMTLAVGQINNVQKHISDAKMAATEKSKAQSNESAESNDGEDEIVEAEEAAKMLTQFENEAKSRNRKSCSKTREDIYFGSDDQWRADDIDKPQEKKFKSDNN